MKKQIYRISIVILALVVSGCHDLLEVEPKTFTSGDNYYQTESQIEAAVNGAYGQLQVLYTTDFYVFTEMRSDNTTFFFNPNNRCCIPREAVDYFLMNAVNDRLEWNWERIYHGIQLSNVILSRIEDVPFTDQSRKDQFIGEAKFLRALYYFHLVRMHGAIPLLVEEVREETEVFSEERANVDQVYQQIIQDTEDAVNNLPSSYPSSEVGRVTKGAALTLLGEIYMTLNDFPSAIDALEEVTELNYTLLPDYADVFDPGNKNHSESIFDVQYDASIEGEWSNFIFIFAPWHAKAALTGFQGQTQSMNIPTPSIINAFEEGDTRKEVSIAYYSDPQNSDFDEAIGEDMPFINKYYHPPYQRDGVSDENWPVYRYADVLLMLAEAYNEIGETEAAYVYINMVRERAGLDQLSGLSVDQFREAVYHERRVELAFENKRWFDLLRTDQAMEVMTAHAEEESQRLSRVTSEMFNVQEYKLLYPIPAKEVRLNGFEQNPGW